MYVRHTSIFLRFFTIVLFIIAFASRASATQWVPVEGRVMFDGTPLCAMVLANGQNMFSCSGDGSFKLSVPLDGNNQVTLFAFASGLAPFKLMLSPQQAANYTVNMVREADGRILTVVNSAIAKQSNRAVVSGTVNYNGTPVCALILANGQHMFSCGESLGNFSLDVQLDSDRNITLFAFASGSQPYKTVIPVSTASTHRLNDTGITTCSDGNTNGLSCPVAGYPWQDAEDGRDVTHNDDSDGHAGFSFTKLDANGNPLSPNATSWSCVEDNVTGLTWEIKTDDGGLQDKDNTYTWYNPDSSINGGDAGTQNGGSCSGSACDTYGYVQAVNAQGLCGSNDWRMPTMTELINIVSRDRFAPSIDPHYFPLTKTTWQTIHRYYWSSSPCAYDSEDAWGVSSVVGNSSGNSKGDDWYVRLVRSEQ